VVDIEPVQAPLFCEGVEAIALREPVLQSTLASAYYRGDRSVGGRKLARSGSRVCTLAMVMDSIALLLALYLRAIVRQVKKGARKRDSQRVSGIQAEEVDTGDAVHHDIGAYIDLKELRQSRNQGRPAGTRIANAKRHDADPGLPLERVKCKGLWHKCAQLAWSNGPVGEEQLVPALCRHPGSFRQRIWSMLNVSQN